MGLLSLRSAHSCEPTAPPALGVHTVTAGALTGPDALGSSGHREVQLLASEAGSDAVRTNPGHKDNQTPDACRLTDPLNPLREGVS